MWSSADVHLSLPTFWFTTASLAVRELLWVREVRSCFVLRHGWQSLYLLLSDRILFDLQLLTVFYLWSNWPQPTGRECFNNPTLPSLLPTLTTWLSVCFTHRPTRVHTLSILACMCYTGSTQDAMWQTERSEKINREHNSLWSLVARDNEPTTWWGSGSKKKCQLYDTRML